MLNHIRNFKNKIDYYKNNPLLKSEECMDIDSAIFNCEATVNYLYCYNYIDIYNGIINTAKIKLPVGKGENIGMSDVSEIYNKIVDTVRKQYTNTTFENKKLIVVDIEPDELYENLIINTFVGNTKGIYYPIKDWLYGKKAGTCDGYFITESDAAKEIEKSVRFYFKEEPPTNCSWFFTGIKIIEINDPTIDELINPDDDIVDNYLDRLVYYANSNITPFLVDSVKCLTHNIEMEFYKNSYINLTQDSMNFYNKKFKDCFYVGTEIINCSNTILRHELKTYIGNRYLIVTDTIPVAIK